MSLVLFTLSLAHAQPHVAIVVIDEEAREQGYTVEVEGWVAGDALPVDVAEGEQVLLVAPSGHTEPLDLAAGEAWEITGEHGEAWMSLLDEEVRTDLIAVRGTPRSIEALADELGAEVLTDGETTWLSGQDVLLRAPRVEGMEAARVSAVNLVRVERELPRITQPAHRYPVRASAPVAVPPAQAVLTPSAESRMGPALGEAPSTLTGRVGWGLPPQPNLAVPAESAPDPGAQTRLAEGWEDPIDPADVDMHYAGTHLCGDDVLWLYPGGTFAARGITGTWSVRSPGVVRLERAGTVEMLGAIDPETRYCRAVWTPLTR